MWQGPWFHIVDDLINYISFSVIGVTPEDDKLLAEMNKALSKRPRADRKYLYDKYLNDDWTNLIARGLKSVEAARYPIYREISSRFYTHSYLCMYIPTYIMVWVLSAIYYI